MIHKVKIDLLKAKYHLDRNQRKPSIFFGYGLVTLFIIFAVTGIIFSYNIHSNIDTNGFHISLFSAVRSLMESNGKTMQGEKEDRINVLLLGVGGMGHDGPELSDTVIFASLKPSEKKIGLLSIPRDLTIPIPEYGWRKINHINAFGENQKQGYGPLFAVQVLGDLFQQEIHYYVKIDFSGFTKLIDDIGGIDVFVDQPFVDEKYPTEDYLYQTVMFEYGWHHMNGKEALIYIRSRHGNNGQGSDFARSRRQQQILLAVKEKIFSASTYLNPLRINRIFETLENHLFTNLNTWELIRLAKLFGNLDQIDVKHHVLDISEGSPLYATSINGAYVILPKEDNWQPIQDMAKNIFADAQERTDTYLSSNDVLSEISPPLSPIIHIEIQNGTTITGLASLMAQYLKGQGFEIVNIGNAKKQTYTQTVMYDFTQNLYEKERKLLENYLKANTQNTSSDWVYGSLNEEETTQETPPVDFLIILGTDAQNLLNL